MKIKEIRFFILRVFLKLSYYGLLNFVPDKLYLYIMYYLKTGKILHLNPPILFNEKLQWLKLYDRNDEYTDYADKYNVRQRVKQLIGEEYLIPLYGRWNTFESIDFDSLPDEFVLKCNHDCGSVIICKDKRNFDYNKTKKIIKKALKKSTYYYGREWPYKNIKPCIIIEKYMKDENSQILHDYKFYCFNGKPEFLYVSKYEHTENEQLSFFNLNWEPTPFFRADHKALDSIPTMPKNFDEMIEIAKKISSGFKFLRVDLYEINGRIYFGETTFFPTSGFAIFEPDDWNTKLGNMLKID